MSPTSPNLSNCLLRVSGEVLYVRLSTLSEYIPSIGGGPRDCAEYDMVSTRRVNESRKYQLANSFTAAANEQSERKYFVARVT